MIKQFLIAVVISVSLDITVPSDFRTMGLTDLPVTHGDLFALGCKRYTTWNLARMFSHYLGQV
jgi:hypothetical protein